MRAMDNETTTTTTTATNSSSRSPVGAKTPTTPRMSWSPLPRASTPNQQTAPPSMLSARLSQISLVSSKPPTPAISQPIKSPKLPHQHQPQPLPPPPPILSLATSALVHGSVVNPTHHKSHAHTHTHALFAKRQGFASKREFSKSHEVTFFLLQHLYSHIESFIDANLNVFLPILQ